MSRKLSHPKIDKKQSSEHIWGWFLQHSNLQKHTLTATTARVARTSQYWIKINPQNYLRWNTHCLNRLSSKLCLIVLKHYLHHTSAWGWSFEDTIRPLCQRASVTTSPKCWSPKCWDTIERPWEPKSHVHAPKDWRFKNAAIGCSAIALIWTRKPCQQSISCAEAYRLFHLEHALWCAE